MERVTARLASATTRWASPPLPDRERVVECHHWTAIENGHHNLTTDLTFWNGHFWLVHSLAPWHIASARSRLVLWRSSDAVTWEPMATFQFTPRDIRDPKVCAIGDRLFLYAFSNDGFVAAPNQTYVTSSADGVTWDAWKEISPKGWLLWRPKTLDQKTWYVPAYWSAHGESVLLKSTDGVKWDLVSKIFKGEFNDETDLEFLPDGRALVTVRLEGNGSLFGHVDGGTMIGVSEAPYTTWEFRKSEVTRLDGPCLFRWGDRVFAAGRRHIDPLSNGRPKVGSIWGRKRTALYEVFPDRLEWAGDFPSTGDTGYPGVVVRGDDAYISYYTNHIDEDRSWGIGMFLPSEIRMAQVFMPEVAVALVFKK